MKKIISISLTILMMAGMVHVTVASHYCEKMGTSSKISFSGQLASCGMEGVEESCPVDGVNLKGHCCDDSVSVYGIDSNFVPSFSVVKDLEHINFHVLNTFTVNLPANTEFLNSSYTNVYPPGVLMSTNVDLSNICVFRI